MLSSLHQAFVDNLARIVFPRLDVDRLFDYCISTASERSSRSILRKRDVGSANADDENVPDREPWLASVIVGA